MQVNTLSVQRLFEKDVIYLVPLFQRPYVWNEAEQWQPLWEDLRRLADGLQEGKQPRAHFLGASVQDRPPMPPGHIETRLLIDGQQRLTTIQLLLKAFADVLGHREDDRYYRAIEKLIRNDHPLSTQHYEEFKVQPTNADRADFQSVMECVDRVSLLKSRELRVDVKKTNIDMIDAYLYFHSKILDWLGEEGSRTRDARIAALYGAIRDNVRLVVIDLDERDDAQLIFETLNARGTPLLASDLVKNSLLNELQNAGHDTETSYRKYWQQFDSDSSFWRAEIGSGHARRARIELFLQHVLTLLTGEEVSAAHLYTAYRDYATGPQAGTSIERLQALRRYSGIYKKLQNWNGSIRIRVFLDRLGTMDIGTAYPFLLKLFDVLSDRQALLIAVLEDVEAFLVRRMICRLSTRSYGTLFARLAQQLEGSTDAIPRRVEAALLEGNAEADRWPDAAELRRAWVENPLYEVLTRPRLRLVLEALEAGLRSKFSETAIVPKNLTVEHVMPQGWDLFWPLPTGGDEAGAAARRNRLIHTIGNLTLISNKLNPSQSNRPWVDRKDRSRGKREALQAHSVLFLNKELSVSERWDEDAIEARALSLLDVANSLWRGPSAERSSVQGQKGRGVIPASLA